MGVSAPIRRARPEEAGLLSDLAYRSKAWWGYDEAFMRACKDELTVSAQDVRGSEIWVCAPATRVSGFYAIAPAGPRCEIDLLFVDPPAIGTGVGRALFEHLVDTARRHGVATVEIASDPGARGFYERMGAMLVGEAPSASIPGRMLPLLEYRIAA